MAWSRGDLAGAVLLLGLCLDGKAYKVESAAHVNLANIGADFSEISYAGGNWRCCDNRSVVILTRALQMRIGVMTYGLHSQDPQYRERRHHSSWECQKRKLQMRLDVSSG
jgi:hypothetical protein